MEHTFHRWKLTNDVHSVLVCLSLMDNNRHIQFLCQFHLGDESLFLDFPGDVLVVVIQADLANGLDLGI